MFCRMHSNFITDKISFCVICILKLVLQNYANVNFVAYAKASNVNIDFYSSNHSTLAIVRALNTFVWLVEFNVNKNIGVEKLIG